MRAILFCAAAALVLAGCTANDKSIHRNITLPSDAPSAQSVDAKQRFLITVPVKEETVTNSAQSSTIGSTSTVSTASTASADASTTTTTQTTTHSVNQPAHVGSERLGVSSRSSTTTQVRFCAEPSPDVFSVYAGALAANLDLKKSVSPADLGLGLGLGISTSEQGSTIARTQTINLLKELMYRTCERYASGGIGKLELAVQSVRDQRVIIAALAIEQLTGAVMPKPTIIGAASSAGTGADAAGAVVAIDKRMTAKAAAEKALEAANAKLAKANGETSLCKEKTSRPEGAVDPTEAEAAACKSAKDDVDKATKDAALAKVELDTLVKSSEIGGPIANVAATLFAAEGKGGIDKASPVSIAAVATAVREIVQANYDSSELELLCVKAFDPSQLSPSAAVVKACEEYFKALIKQKEARAIRAAAEDQIAAAQGRQVAAQINERTEKLLDSREMKFIKFWQLIPSEREKRIANALKSTKGSRDELEKLRAVTEEDEARSIFTDFTSTVVNALMKEAAK